MRNACVFVLRRAARAWRGRLASRVSVVMPLDSPHLRFEPLDSMVVEAMYWYGIYAYEGVVGPTWERLCSQAHSILEVGGNIGIHTVLGGRACRGSYTVVEPVPEIAAALSRHLQLNGLAARVRLLPAAVVPMQEESEVVFNIPDESRAVPVGAHLASGVEIDPRSDDRAIHVRGIPFSDLMRGCDLIKIDAEGIEAALLQSARPALLAARPTLLVEVLPEAHGLAHLLRDLAVEAGYRITILPEFSIFQPVPIDPAEFTAASPKAFNAKDVLLSVEPLPR